MPQAPVLTIWQTRIASEYIPPSLSALNQTSQRQRSEIDERAFARSFAQKYECDCLLVRYSLTKTGLVYQRIDSEPIPYIETPDTD